MYFVSVRQILEAEKAIRLRSLLKFSGMSLQEVREGFEEVDAQKEEAILEESQKLVSLLDHEFIFLEQVEEDANVCSRKYGTLTVKVS